MTSQHIKPTTKANRVVEIDIIRGFALFGVLLVNLTMMHQSMFSAPQALAGLSGINALSAAAIGLFAQGKFYTIFSFLFGLGFYYFIDRPHVDEKIVGNRFKRRMYALLLFGMGHLVFVWFGDILHSYALCGFILFSKRNRTDAQFKRSIVILLIVSLLIIGLASSAGPDAGYEAQMVEKANAAYTGTSYMAMVIYRITNELPLVLANLIAVVPKLLAMFYMGYLSGRHRVFHQLDQHQRAIKTIWRFAAVTSLICFAAIIGLGRLSGFLPNFLKGMLNEVTTVSGSAFYVTTLLLLLKSPFKRFLSPLQYSGRMALTNYLTQTIFWTTLINGYGLGYFGKIPYWAFFPLALVFYAIQIAFSALWLRRFNFGPMEKLWRTMTYGAS